MGNLAAAFLLSAMIEPTVEISLKGLAKFRERITSGTSPPIPKILMLWNARYRGFVSKRFDSYSKGSGNWKKLSEATIRRRRKGSQTILRDTNTLFAALNPSIQVAPGSIAQPGNWFIIVGYGGPAQHPRGRASIADIASFHNAGAGHLPKRQIIVSPQSGFIPSDVTKAMASDAERLLTQQSIIDIG